jgi:hypothetical protein
MSETHAPDLPCTVSDLFGWRFTLSVDVTVQHLEAALCAPGFTLFAGFNHCLAAREADLDLSPTEVFVFGNSKGGTLLMRSAPTLAFSVIDGFFIFILRQLHKCPL